MRRRPVSTIAAVLALALALTGCSGPATVKSGATGLSEQERGIRSTVTLYNALLAEGYARQNMSGLAEVASEDQAYTEYLHMSAIGEMERRLVSTLTSMTFESVTVSGTAATVRTRETWDYEHISIAKATSGTVQLKEHDVVYRLTYSLELRKDRWIVTAVVDTETGAGAGSNARESMPATASAP